MILLSAVAYSVVAALVGGFVFALRSYGDTRPSADAAVSSMIGVFWLPILAGIAASWLSLED